MTRISGMSIDSFSDNETAIVALTRKGVELGRRLRPLLPGSHLYLPEKFAVEGKPDEHSFLPPAKEIVGEVFRHYRYLVLIMAVGIAVRLIASELGDKHKDPGVVVLDDAGTFSISLLSGHIGGANELSKKIASFLGAHPVVTTASEVGETISVDLLGKEFDWELEDNSNVTKVSAALVNGESISIYQDAGERNWWPETRPLPDNVRIFTSIAALIKANCSAALFITDRIIGKEDQTLLPRHAVIYRPKSLVIGIGCKRGTMGAEIEGAVAGAFSEHGLSLKSIRNVATIDLKKDEAGLLEFTRKYHLPIEYFDKETLSNADFPSPASAMALKHVGTPAVCESAAILSSATSLFVPKASFKGAVTVAVARLPFNSDKQKNGKLFLIGLGPGNPEHMTFRAREALSESEVVVGYKTYIKLIEPFLRQKEVIATGMGAEIERAKIAIDLAKKGRTVSIVSSGDAGIYGMAGLVSEIIHEQSDELVIEFVPGVPAIVAAAALLGAPVMTDFAAISLSDYLISWAEISQRLKLAAQGNFVIALYNPRSKKRQRQLTEAREIILQYRSPLTPVGIVTHAYRPQQQVVITDLAHILDYEVDMNTTIIIGNSTTFTFSGRMVTPRGYQKKYSLRGGVSQGIKVQW
ncbi:precorrin-3B C(17)-methyltransferase [Chloroflexota bacterium]